MGQFTHLVILGALGAVALLAGTQRVDAAPAPKVSTIIEARDAGGSRTTLIVVGKGVALFKKYALKKPDTTDAGALSVAFRSGTELGLRLPDALAPGSYSLELKFGKSGVQTYAVEVTSGAFLDLAAGGTVAGRLIVSSNDGVVFGGAFGAGAAPSSGMGTQFVWSPVKAAIRAGFADSDHWDDVNVGAYSVGMGRSTKASGLSAVALGASTTASGDRSTALGVNTVASAFAATAAGSGSVASGPNSFAAGYVAAASGDSAAALGSLVSASGGSSLATGNSTTASGGSSLATGNSTTASGFASTAMGNGSTAGGDRSTATGSDTTAPGYASTAMGRETSAGGYAATALGNGTIASGDYATSTGLTTTAGGFAATALGELTEASGSRALAAGLNTTASAFATTALGHDTTASGDRSVAMGFATVASGVEATAMGTGTTAQAVSSLVIGRFNVVAGTSASVVDTDPVFVAGNGTGDGARSNALTLLRNGNLTIAGGYASTSDARLKTDIAPLSGVLAKLADVSAVAYRFKEGANGPSGPQVGLVAQELQKVFPELVQEAPDGTLAVVYGKFSAVLLAAVKEQQAEIGAQRAKLDARDREVAALREDLRRMQAAVAELARAVRK